MKPIAPPWRSLCVTNSAAPSPTLGTCIMGRREFHPPPLRPFPFGWGCGQPMKSFFSISRLNYLLNWVTLRRPVRANLPPPSRSGVEWSPSPVNVCAHLLILPHPIDSKDCDSSPSSKIKSSQPRTGLTVETPKQPKHFDSRSFQFIRLHVHSLNSQHLYLGH